MEELLHYAWRHRLLRPVPLVTTGGEDVEIISPGLPNAGDGPDFLGARIRIGGTLWAGSVELHVRSSDWRLHGHDTDPRYDGVVLHVAETVDADVITCSGRRLPQLVLPLPEHLAERYARLTAADGASSCRHAAAALPAVTSGAWLSALAAERLAERTEAIVRRAEHSGASWEKAAFVTLARAFGFGANSDAFEQWATALPLDAVGHHRDDAFQVEALFLGGAGLLEEDCLPRSHREEALADGYYQRLKAEYGYLARKFGLTAIDGHAWHFLRLRPQNFPYVRLSQLAALYVERRLSLSQMTDCRTPEDVRRLLDCRPSAYWRTHYAFGRESRESEKRLTAASRDLLTLNAVAPLLFAYGRHRRDEALSARALTLLESLPAEDNAVVRAWRTAGLAVRSASDSQAILQLERRYCAHHDCLRCRFGYAALK